MNGNEGTNRRMGWRGEEGSHLVRMDVLRGFDIIMASTSIPRHVPWSCTQSCNSPGDQYLHVKYTFIMERAQLPWSRNSLASEPAWGSKHSNSPTPFFKITSY
jgi:hypothetical protein